MQLGGGRVSSCGAYPSACCRHKKNVRRRIGWNTEQVLKAANAINTRGALKAGVELKIRTGKSHRSKKHLGCAQLVERKKRVAGKGRYQSLAPQGRVDLALARTKNTKALAIAHVPKQSPCACNVACALILFGRTVRFGHEHVRADCIRMVFSFRMVFVSMLNTSLDIACVVALLARAQERIRGFSEHS